MSRRVSRSASVPLQYKDDVLLALSHKWNVARFVSFAPNLSTRHRVLADPPPPNASLSELLEALLRQSAHSAVNVRSFLPERPSGNPFELGFRTVDSVVAFLKQLAGQGYFCIVNEMIPPDDGGVSGVWSAGLVEFAPDDTPRCVERPGTCALPSTLARRFFRTVYGFAPNVGKDARKRVEFSIHPSPVGHRREQVLVWEESDSSATSLSRPLRWPNRMSRHLGDKTFGLLIGHLLGAPVPMTDVVGRRVRPFRFGETTETGDHWMRTAPAARAAGRYFTGREWRDPFRLLADEDPDHQALAALLVQEGVGAKFSGTAQSQESASTIVEGVGGFGDRFMLGDVGPEPLPRATERRVRRLHSSLASALGPTQIEWADDGQRTWLLQLHVDVAGAAVDGIYPGDLGEFLEYAPGDDEHLDRLQDTINEASRRGVGVLVLRDVGRGSHVAERLVRHRIPSRVKDRSAENA